MSPEQPEQPKKREQRRLAQEQKALAKAERKREEGYWPRPLKRLTDDFKPAKFAPAQDGVVAPEFVPPPWIAQVSELPEALSVASEARKDAMAAAKTAEDKSSPVVQTSLTLLTITIALGAYQVKFAFDRGGISWLSLLPIAGAFFCLALAAFEANEITRVGVYASPSLEDLAELGGRTAEEALLTMEEKGRFLARWTAVHKLTSLMQARAWFSRGLTMLIIAGVVAGVCRAGATSPAEPPTTTTVSTSPASAIVGPTPLPTAAPATSTTLSLRTPTPMP